MRLRPNTESKISIVDSALERLQHRLNKCGGEPHLRTVYGFVDELRAEPIASWFVELSSIATDTP